MLDIVEKTTTNYRLSNIYNMKRKVQGWRSGSTEDWTKHIGVTLHPVALKIGNYSSSGIYITLPKTF